MTPAAYRTDSDDAPATLRSSNLPAPLPLVTVKAMQVCIEKLHSRSREYVVAVYIGNYTRFTHKLRSTDPMALQHLFQQVCKHLKTPAQVQKSKVWVADTDLSSTKVCA